MLRDTLFPAPVCTPFLGLFPPLAPLPGTETFPARPLPFPHSSPPPLAPSPFPSLSSLPCTCSKADRDAGPSQQCPSDVVLHVSTVQSPPHTSTGRSSARQHTLDHHFRTQSESQGPSGGKKEKQIPAREDPGRGEAKKEPGIRFHRRHPSVLAAFLSGLTFGARELGPTRRDGTSKNRSGSKGVLTEGGG